MSDTFCGERKESSERNYSDSVERKDHVRIDAGKVRSDTCRNENEQDIYPAAEEDDSEIVDEGAKEGFLRLVLFWLAAWRLVGTGRIDDLLIIMVTPWVEFGFMSGIVGPCFHLVCISISSRFGCTLKADEHISCKS